MLTKLIMCGIKLKLQLELKFKNVFDAEVEALVE